jgi:ribose transport system substrate-binding protein
MRSFRYGLTALLAACVVLVTACGDSNSSSSSNSGSSGATSAGSTSASTAAASGDCKWKVGYAEPVAAQEIDAIEDAALIKGGKRRGICVTVLDSALDVNKQLGAVNQFVAQKMDAIIVFPLSPNSLKPALDKARAAGIKLIGNSAIVTDKQPTGSIAPYDALFEQDSAVAGAKMLAEHVREKLGGKGTALGVGIGIPVPSLKFMMEQYTRAVTDGSDIQWLATVDNPTDDIAGGQKVVSEAVTRFAGKKIDAVLTYNTSSGVGAYQALQRSNSKDAVIVAQNGDTIGVDGLESGKLSAMTDIMPWRSALQLLDITERVLEGKEVPKLTFGRPILYTKDNLHERLDWKQAVEDIASGKLTCENAGCTKGETALTAG